MMLDKLRAFACEMHSQCDRGYYRIVRTASGIEITLDGSKESTTLKRRCDH